MKYKRIPRNRLNTHSAFIFLITDNNSFNESKNTSYLITSLAPPVIYQKRNHIILGLVTELQAENNTTYKDPYLPTVFELLFFFFFNNYEVNSFDISNLAPNCRLIRLSWLFKKIKQQQHKAKIKSDTGWPAARRHRVKKINNPEKIRFYTIRASSKIRHYIKNSLPTFIQLSPML